jgi:hypothetical protein
MIFPFTVKAYDNTYYVQQPQCRKSFLAVKPKDLLWYAFDVTVLTAEEAEFTVYDMADFVYGGIGKKTTTLKGRLTKEESDSLIKSRINSLSEYLEEQEFKLARKKRVLEIQEELKASLTAG